MTRTITCKVCGRPFSGDHFPNGHICPSCNKKRAKAYREAKRTGLDRRRKLTPEQVEQIRTLRKQGRSMGAIATAFNISKPVIVGIINGTSWKR
jgi:hypothetical protein